MAVRDDACDRAATLPSAVSGFRESGIHPFDRGEFRGQFASENLQSAPGNSSSFHHFAGVNVSAINQSV